MLFIAAILVAASLAGTVTEGTTQLGSALGDQSQQQAEAVDAEIEIVSDAGSPESVYDHDTGTLTLYAKNVGGSTLPADPDVISVLVNGEYQTDVEATVLDANSWGDGNLLRLRVDVSLQPRADTRVVVTPTGARDRFRFRTPADEDADAAGRQEIVFASDNSLRSVTADGSVTDYDVTAHSIGPKEIDFDNDGYREVPYANNNTLKLIDERHQETTLAKGVKEGATIGVGEWNDATNMFYTNSSDNGNIYRVSPETDPSLVGDGIASQAVGGPADFNDDGDTELVFLGGSATVKYYDGGTVESTTFSNGHGFGKPRKFDGEAPARAPVVDESGYPALLAHDESSPSLRLTDTDSAMKQPVAGIDWTGDERLEHVFVNSSGSIRYVTIDGNVTTVLEDVTVDSDVGVA